METKNILTIFILLAFLAVLILPTKTSAQYEMIEQCTLRHDVDFITDGAGTCEKDDTVSEGSPDEWALCCIVDAIFTISDWVFYILIGVSAIMVIMGAFNIATAGGDPGKVSTGRNYIMYAMIGLLVALFSRSIPSITRGLIG